MAVDKQVWRVSTPQGTPERQECIDVARVRGDQAGLRLYDVVETQAEVVLKLSPRTVRRFRKVRIKN